MHPALRPNYQRMFLAQTNASLSSYQTRFFSNDKPNETKSIEIPPEPTTCCMSGCANCVWVEYAEQLSKLFEGNSEKARQIILDKISDPNLKAFLSAELRNLPNEKDENN